MSEDITIRFNLLLAYAKPYFLLTLDPDKVVLITRDVLHDFYDKPEHAWVVDMGLQKIRSNCHTWKSRGLALIEVSYCSFALLYILILLAMGTEHPG
jgi:hypothetical protein